MKYLLLNTFTLASIFVGSFAQSQSSGARCGETTPRFCVGESVRYAGKDQPVLGVSQGLSTYLLKDMYNDDVQVGANNIGKKSGRGETDPNFRADEPVRFAGKTQKILGIRNNGKQYVLKDQYGDDVTVSADNIGKQSGRGKTNPSFSFGETVRYAGYDQIVLGIVNNTVYILKDSYKDDVRVSAQNIGKIRNKDSNSIDSISVYLSPDTQDIFESYTTLAKVTTKERSAFLKTLSAQVKVLNSGDVNLFAGFLFSKLVQRSSAQVVKDNFAPQVAKYLAELEKSNWKSLQQVAANEQTISFAIQVIAAGVRVRNTQAQVSPETEIRLKFLAGAAAKKGLVAKAIALRQFITDNSILIEDLVADPRHGAIGSLIADVAQWTHKNFEE